MRWWELFQQAVVGAARARLRSALTAAGIAIGCGALVSMVAFALGLQQQMEAPFKKLGLLNDIRVTAQAAERRDRDAKPKNPDGDQVSPPGPRLDDAALKSFAAIPGVKYAYPDLRLSDVAISRGDKRESAVAIALPREAGLADATQQLLTAGAFFSLDDVPETVVAEGLAKKLGFESGAAAIGQEVDVSASGLAAGAKAGQFEFQKKQTSLRIVGVFQAGFGPFGDNGQIALIPVDVMQQLPGLVESQLGRFRRAGAAEPGTYREIVVRAESPLAVEDVARQITDQGFQARTMISRLDEARMAFLFIKSLLTAVGSVAMVIAGLGIANTLLMTVLERYEEIGLYKAIGATDGDVRLLFLSEATVLGLVGGLAGLALASAVCWLLQWGVTLFLRSRDVTREVDVFYFPWWLLAGGVLFSIVVAILSGLYPASRAARVDPIQALRRG